MNKGRRAGGPRGPFPARTRTNPIPFLAGLVALSLGLAVQPGTGQPTSEWFPDEVALPRLLAGPRDPLVSASVVGVTKNPNQHGEGVEVEVSFGHALPLILFREANGDPRVLVGLEAGVFARFGLQVLERELIASDWYFMVPALWPKDWGWIRFRYYHSSSHMGDEYIRRFEDAGVNFSRDAADFLSYYRARPWLGVYGGVRFAYNVHPEESGQLVLRTGMELQRVDLGRGMLPYVAVDVEFDEDTAPDTRFDVKAGLWLPPVRGTRSIRVALGALWGPSPLGQFQSGTTTQFSMGLEGFF